jgi:hypothetical protein
MERPDRTSPKDWAERIVDAIIAIACSVVVWFVCKWAGGTPGECFIAGLVSVHALEIKDKIARGFTRTGLS